MNMDQSLLAFVILIGAVIVGRLIGEAGLKLLTTEQKGQLIEKMAPIRKYGLVVFVVLIIATWSRPLWLAAAVFLYIVGSYGLSFIKVRQLALPAGYMRNFAISMAVSLLGVVVFFIVLGTASP